MKAPRHIAIILDGNRRYSKKVKKRPWEGHEAGAKNVENLINWARELKIKTLTLYAFSTENFSRSMREVAELMKLFMKRFEKLQENKGLHKGNIRVNVIGDTNKFPKKVRESMELIASKTRRNNGLVVNFAMGYGGRKEISDACQKIIDKKIKKVDEKTIEDNLYTKDEPDLLIRPGGEKRISNFLIWQAAYSELIFMKKLWPEFTKKDLINCIEEFKRRKRRFGK